MKSLKALPLFASLAVGPSALAGGPLYEEARVKIFPHNSAFPTPQGKEPVMNALKFTTKGTCTLYLAPTSSS